MTGLAKTITRHGFTSGKIAIVTEKGLAERDTAYRQVCLQGCVRLESNLRRNLKSMSLAMLKGFRFYALSVSFRICYLVIITNTMQCIVMNK